MYVPIIIQLLTIFSLLRIGQNINSVNITIYTEQKKKVSTFVTTTIS